jgi:hypothetical protein
LPRWAGAASGGALAGAAIGLSLLASAPLLAHREFAGSAALVRQIATRIDPIGVVMVDDDLVGWRFSAPLQFLTHRSTFVPFGEASKDDRGALALAAWQADERPLYWLRHGEPAPFDRWGRRWEPVQSWLTELPYVAVALDTPPRDLPLFAVPVTLYRAAR